MPSIRISSRSKSATITSFIDRFASSPSLIVILTPSVQRVDPLERRLLNPARCMAEMDRSGVERCIMSLTSPGVQSITRMESANCDNAIEQEMRSVPARASPCSKSIRSILRESSSISRACGRSSAPASVSEKLRDVRRRRPVPTVLSSAAIRWLIVAAALDARPCIFPYSREEPSETGSPRTPPATCLTSHPHCVRRGRVVGLSGALR